MNAVKTVTLKDYFSTFWMSFIPPLVQQILNYSKNIAIRWEDMKYLLSTFTVTLHKCILLV